MFWLAGLLHRVVAKQSSGWVMCNIYWELGVPVTSPAMGAVSTAESQAVLSRENGEAVWGGDDGIRVK